MAAPERHLPYPTYAVADYQMPHAACLTWTCPECDGSVKMSASLFICEACELQIPNFPGGLNGR